MKCKIPEISWHNRDPVLSVDIQLNGAGLNAPTLCRLASGGTDAHVLIWYINQSEEGEGVELELAADLARHQRAVNTVRWSPDGQLLASGDDESVIFIWKQKADHEVVNIVDAVGNSEQDREVWLTLKILRGHREDIYDLSWAPNSQFLVTGSVDNTAMLWDVYKGKSLAILDDHKGYVQGVAWDPCNQYIATLSTDRQLRIFDVNTRRVLQRVCKTTLPVKEGHELYGRNVRLYHDGTLQTFFRRLCFTPDGKLLITPAGVTDYDGVLKPTHTTYGYSRYDLSKPAFVLPFPNEYTVAVRCSPVLYRLRPYNAEKNPPIITLPYRMIYAVATKNSVFFYDTQQPVPFAIVSNIHYTRLTDLTWSNDGNILIVSSTDGFCSLLTFSENELGERYEDMDAVLCAVSKISQNAPQRNRKSKKQKFRKASMDDSIKRWPLQEKTKQNNNGIKCNSSEDASNECKESAETDLEVENDVSLQSSSSATSDSSPKPVAKVKPTPIAIRRSPRKPAEPTPIAIRREPRQIPIAAPATIVEPKPTPNAVMRKASDDDEPLQSKPKLPTILLSKPIEAVLDKEIISSDEKFESPEKKSRPATPIQMRMKRHTYSLIHTQRPESPDWCSTQAALATQILAGDSIVLIGAASEQCDNYVQPLCQLAVTITPRILVLVATRRRLQQLRFKFEEQLNGQHDICGIEQLAVGTPMRTGIWLVTTMQLFELLEQREEQLKDVQLKTLVLDELQLLQAYGGNRFQAVKAKLWKLCSGSQLGQLVVSSHMCLAGEMEELMQYARQPLVLFYEPLEAAFYGGLELQVELGDTFEQQLQQLKDFLQQQAHQKRRTLIFCSNESDFQALQRALPTDDYLLHGGRRDMAQLQLWQRQVTGKLLLLRSHAPELQVDNVLSLIHFNMPTTWSQFRRRFEVLKAQIPNALGSHEGQLQLQALVLLDKQSECMLPQLLECMQQHGQPIGEQVTAAHAQLQATREATLVARSCVICPVLLLHGRCLRLTCLYRHQLSHSDRQCGTVPTAGLVRFQLLKICTPAHFAARLLAYGVADSDSTLWQALPIQEKFKELQQELCSYYATPGNRVAVSEPVLQQICVRQTGADCYERVRVTFVSDNRSAAVRVRQLDASTVICHAKPSELLLCPQQLQQIEPLALDVRLPGLVPYDGEEAWQHCDMQPIDNLLLQNASYEASVAFSLSHTIFVEKLQLPGVDYAQQLQRLGLARVDVEAQQRLKDIFSTNL